MKIILDAMGGDNGVRAAVEGAIEAVKRYEEQVVLVGKENEIAPLLKELGGEGLGLTVVNATEVVTMEDDAQAPVRTKKDSSLAVALNLLANGEGDALVSAGNTGAVLTGATLVIKRIKGVRRAALVPTLPTAKGGAVLIDCGANVTCTPEYLIQFAHMGAIYAEKQLGIKAPKVGLVNNGAEETKGTEVYIEANRLMREAKARGEINFIGNVEGRDVPMGACDVVVCDGFIGNVLLKSIEGTAMYLVKEIKGMFMQSMKTKVAALLMKSSLAEFKKKLDYTEVGGAPLLGIAKPVIKAHGSSNANAIRGAINQAILYARSGTIAEIEKRLSQE